ncbi:hypothetical protein HK102_011554, partial [Quaeritorhiza haematococci]
QDIWYDSDRLAIRAHVRGSGAGFGVVGLKETPAGTVVCRIPKQSVLSIKNCGIADIIEEENLGGMLALALALMFEISQGQRSPWFAYIQSLPKREPIPIFWDKEQRREWLKGTDAEEAVETCEEAMREDYEENIVPLFAKYPDIFCSETPSAPSKQQKPKSKNNVKTNKGSTTPSQIRVEPSSYFSFEAFLDASSLVSSRAFQVDAYHGDAMVPLADIFNHKSGAEHVHIESIGDVCPACGIYDNCDCFEDLDHTSLDMEGTTITDANESESESEDSPSHALVPSEPTTPTDSNSNSDSDSDDDNDADWLDMTLIRAR